MSTGKRIIEQYRSMKNKATKKFYFCHPATVITNIKLRFKVRAYTCERVSVPVQVCVCTCVRMHLCVCVPVCVRACVKSSARLQ